jgi:hypothetical protein
LLDHEISSIPTVSSENHTKESFSSLTSHTKSSSNSTPSRNGKKIKRFCSYLHNTDSFPDQKETFAVLIFSSNRVLSVFITIVEWEVKKNNGKRKRLSNWRRAIKEKQGNCLFCAFTLTNVVWSGAFVETREFKADDASDSTFTGYFVPNDKFDVRMLLLLLLNLNSIQGIAELLRSPWVDDGEMLKV